MPTLNADFAKVTGKTIGTVSGLEYSYTHDSKTLVISKTSGAFDPADVFIVYFIQASTA
jgi:hypothetical protein